MSLRQVATTSTTDSSRLQPANSNALQPDVLPSALPEVQRETPWLIPAATGPCPVPVPSYDTDNVSAMQVSSNVTELNVDAKEFVPAVTMPWSTSPAAVSQTADSHNSASATTVYQATSSNNEPPAVTSVLPRRNGLFITGRVEGQKVRFLIDTGAEPTILSTRILRSLPKTLRSAFQDKSTRLQLADGQPLHAQGPVLCNLTIGDKTVVEAVYVAPVEDEAILGLDTLRALGLNLSLAGVSVEGRAHVRRVTAPCVRRVKVSRDYIIPARSEMTVQGQLEGPQLKHCALVSAGGAEKCDKIMIGKCLVQSNTNVCPVRLLNLSEEDITLSAGQYIGEAEEVDLLSNEDNVAAPMPPSSAPTHAHDLPGHIKELFEETCEREQLDTVTSESLKRLLIKHADVFALHDDDLGRTNLVQHDINTGDTPPIRQPPRRVPTTLQSELDAEIESMLAKGAIEPGQSPWASPVVLVRKKDGSLRFCVDYRKVNAVTEFDAYPLPRIDETLEALGGARFFTTLDLLSGYWQVGLTPEARLKSAFCVRGGLYLFNVMPFGLCNAPSTFERLMETVLQGLQWRSCLVYLDDVVIFGRTEQELISRMDDVFSRLKQAGLKLKPRKCRLFSRKTDYLGHVISEHGVMVSPDKIAAVKNWPTPENVTDVRSFLGTAAYYRRFVADFATIATPLHRLTEKFARFEWTNECQRSFDTLKAALCDAPVLAFPVPDAPYVLDTDASLTGLGAVLSQVVDGKERVLGYASRSLSKCERNYCVTRRELLAVVWALRHFRPYLYGRQFTVRSDHASLRWLQNFKEPEGQIARWLQVIGEYKFDIQHRPGKQHGNADGLSRQPCKQCGRVDDETPDQLSTNNEPAVCIIALSPEWDSQQLSKWQQEDTEIAPIVDALREDKKPVTSEVTAWPAVTKQYVNDWERLKLIDNVLYKEWSEPAGNNRWLLVVPRALRAKVLQTAHDSPLAGHLGPRRTYLRVREQYYWIGMSADCRIWCQTCKTCCGRRLPPSRPHHPLVQDPVGEPLQRVAVDILGPLEPPTNRGNRYVLVVVDYLTKWAEAYAMPDQTAETVASVFVTEFVCRYGVPTQLHSDQGRQFEADLFQGMCDLLGIKKTRTTPLHPQSDGQTERMNRTLLDILSKLAKDEPRQWDVQLPFAMASYRSSCHSTTEETPNRLMLGREVSTPVSLLILPPQHQVEKHPWVKDLQNNFQQVHERVVINTRRAHRTQKRGFDRRQKGYFFEPEDQVWLYEPRPVPGRPRKLDASRWGGPYVVCERLSNATYKIRRPNSSSTRVVNVDRLTPYVCRDTQRLPDYVEDDDVASTTSDLVQVPTTHEGDEYTDLLSAAIPSTETACAPTSEPEEDTVSPTMNEQQSVKGRIKRKRRKRQVKVAGTHHRTEGSESEETPAHEHAVQVPVSTRPKRQSKASVRLQDFVLSDDVSICDTQPAVRSICNIFQSDNTDVNRQKVRRQPVLPTIHEDCVTAVDEPSIATYGHHRFKPKTIAARIAEFVLMNDPFENVDVREARAAVRTTLEIIQELPNCMPEFNETVNEFLRAVDLGISSL